MVISRLHHEIKFRWNKMNSNHKVDFYPSELDDAINKATDDYVEIFTSGNNSKEYKLGFEVTQQRTDMLSTLVVSEKNITPTLVHTNLYRVQLSNLTPSYRHFINGWVLAQNCTRRIPITIVRHNDLASKLLDTNQQPNLEWNRCLAVFNNQGMYLYTNYVITNVYLEYIANPVKVFSSGYDSLEYMQGDTSAYKAADPIVNSDLPSTYHDLLVDMTCQYLARTLEDENKFNLLKEQILSKT